MSFLDLREPVNAWTHGLWMILAIPATVLLCLRCGGGLGRRVSFLVFGMGLAACFGGSALFHGVQGPPSRIEVYDRIDHIGIFLLIAGSYTPIAWNLLDIAWRRRVLAMAWGIAGLGSFLYVGYGVLPRVIGTSIYLAMGWGAIFCYIELAKQLSAWGLFPLLLGGVLYSVGAVINLMHWPIVWSGTFGSHELFHVFVMAGSLCHYLFMLKVVIPACLGRAPRPLVGAIEFGAGRATKPRRGPARLQAVPIRSDYRR